MEVKNSERNRELEDFASLEPRVCEVLLYMISLISKHISSKVMYSDFLTTIVCVTLFTSEDKDILLSQISLLESSMREGSNGILAGPTFKWFTIKI